MGTGPAARPACPTSSKKLVKCADLKGLTIKNAFGVSGDVEALVEPLQDYEVLALPCAPLTGDIAAFSQWSSLRHLDVRFGTLTGDVATLGNCPALVTVMLHWNKELQGDIAALANCQELQTLWAFRTAVSGDVGAFGQCSKLVNFKLYSTNVSGDVGGLAPCSNLEVIYLSDTAVGGDWANLVACTALKDVDLTNTHIQGDPVAFKKERQCAAWW